MPALPLRLEYVEAPDPRTGRYAGLQSRPSPNGVVGAEFRWACEFHVPRGGSPSAVYGNYTPNRSLALAKGREHENAEYASRAHHEWLELRRAEERAAHPATAADASPVDVRAHLDVDPDRWLLTCSHHPALRRQYDARTTTEDLLGDMRRHRDDHHDGAVVELRLSRAYVETSLRAPSAVTVGRLVDEARRRGSRPVVCGNDTFATGGVVFGPAQQEALRREGARDALLALRNRIERYDEVRRGSAIDARSMAIDDALAEVEEETDGGR